MSLLHITVVYAPAARMVRELAVLLPLGSTVADAIQASGLQAEYPALDLVTTVLGIWGRKTSLDQRLRDGDRLELYRPLRVDPKVARRERFTRQGAKTAGLFARRRLGAKAGY